MNKSTSAIIAISLLFTSWLATTWYTGKIVEDNIDRYTTKTNQLLTREYKLFDDNIKRKLYQDGITEAPALELISHNRGLTSSEVQYRINNLPFPFTFYANIQHGPFPIGLIQQGSLLPKAAFVQFITPDIEIINYLKTMSNGKQPFSLTSAISYDDGQTLTHFKLAPMKGLKGFTHINIKGIELIFDISGDFNNSTINAKIDLFKVSMGLAGIEINDFKFLADNRRFTSNSYVGNQILTLKSFQLIGADLVGIPSTSISNISITSHAEPMSKEHASYKANVNIGNLRLKTFDIGHFQFELFFTDIAIQSLTELVKTANKLDSSTTAQMNQVLLPLVESILSARPKLQISSFIWQNNAGQAKGDFDIQLKNPGPDALLSDFDFATRFASLVENANFKLDSDKPMVILFTTQRLLLETNSPYESFTREEAKKQISTWHNEPLFKLIAVNKENSFESHLAYKDHFVIANGHSVRIDNFMKTFNESL